ncbi:MAG: AAC(3) family N-acetyltransferase [Verrucomicrobiia bacterium]
MWKWLKRVWRKSCASHVTRADIVSCLRAMGVGSGGLVQVHSSLSSFGFVEGGAETVVDALLELVGPDGTVMMPTFNHGAEYVFDVRTSPSYNGTITDALRRRPQAVRSIHATHAYAAIGPLAAELCAGHLEAGTFGMESPLGKLAQCGGWVLLLGVGMNRCTAAHLGERKAGAHCIGWDQEPRRIRDPQTGAVIPAKADVWRNGPCQIEWEPLERRMRERGLIQDGRIGECRVMRMKAMDVIDVACEMVREICPACRTMPTKSY